MDIGAIQRSLNERGLDGWLFCDFRGSDPLARGVLGLSPDRIGTRRWFYFLPAKGTATRLVHAIEPAALDGLPGDKLPYSSWKELEEKIGKTVAGRRRIAMQYSPRNAIPYVARVDAGTIELVRSFGVEVVSSADLVQEFEATLDEEQYAGHVRAGEILGRLVQEAFRRIGQAASRGAPASEWEIQRFLLERLEVEGLEGDHPPIVAAGAHGADPHFAPEPSSPALLKGGEPVLLDIWAKERCPRSIYADITWVGFVGGDPPEEYRKVFSIVRDARDRVVAAIEAAQSAGKPIRGCDADDVARGFIAQAGYGECFIHRTGHSIHQTGHGNGANLDNLETRDERRLVPRTLFSVEPGVYLPGRFGVRSEINVFLPDASSAVVTPPEPQREIVRIAVE